VICVADSGSTKTDWVIANLNGSEQSSFKSIGLNPFFVNETMVEQTVFDAIPEQLALQVKHVYFYGAGCSSAPRNAIIEEGLKRVFLRASSVHVYHDLLGAARACCQRAEGIASILGTGSNSCQYDGAKIVDNVTNLGFILGDEGSGGHIGKELIRARSYREMPPEIEADFDANYHYQHEMMLSAVYNKPMPNRYVASYAPFCGRHRDTPFVQGILKKVFTSFVKNHLVKYHAPAWPHHFLGSIACEYERELRAVMDTHGLTMGQVVRKPIGMLTDYHLEEHAI
jgi:glucosamine kinase